ncbi:hypothetical protein HCN44_006216 [Aphidius gifuensis]|uniref:Calponin-homology (CH) domain-containing protein n=1 Tax=Aphidius gifuensis TaxID=684658 RepID=A0A834Y3Z9_APHGI|nr:sperm flagellar protein 1-like [Aphidius gifuensis]KAF7997645.1 hypothetical protein HCN44_006216 [Aphidius gifuensis]
MSSHSDEEFNEVIDEIYTWLDQQTFSRPRKNISRDFSNGVFMAEILKKYYPKLVDLHNYSHSNSLTKKIDNWCTLNRKVLSKIDLKISNDVINQLANSHDKTIETVLIKLRSKIIKDCNDERNLLYADSISNDTKTEVESVLDFDEVQNKMIPRSAFLKLRQELQDKNDIINSLNDKISHLESLIKLKDQRIADLSTQIITLDKQDI